MYEVENYNCHKNKIRTNEPKIWQNNKNTEPQPKLSGSYNNKKECIYSQLSISQTIIESSTYQVVILCKLIRV